MVWNSQVNEIETIIKDTIGATTLSLTELEELAKIVNEQIRSGTIPNTRGAVVAALACSLGIKIQQARQAKQAEEDRIRAEQQARGQSSPPSSEG